jgi:hypothetical protein
MLGVWESLPRKEMLKWKPPLILKFGGWSTNQGSLSTGVSGPGQEGTMEELEVA